MYNSKCCDHKQTHLKNQKTKKGKRNENEEWVGIRICQNRKQENISYRFDLSEIELVSEQSVK
jgi:hypothetical protein